VDHRSAPNYVSTFYVMERLGVHDASRDLVASMNGTAMLVALLVGAAAVFAAPRHPRRRASHATAHGE
jgi:hypothetical protein